MGFHCAGEDCNVPEVELPLGTGPVSKAEEHGQGRADSEPVDERGVGGVIEETVDSIRASVLLLRSFVRKEEGLPFGADESKLDGLVVQ